jgi:hypothetical protein
LGTRSRTHQSKLFFLKNQHTGENKNFFLATV